MKWKSPGPILPEAIVRALDEYISERLPSDPNVILSISCKNRRVQLIFPPSWPRARVAKSLQFYMAMRRDRWDINHPGKSGGYKITRKIYCVNSRPHVEVLA